MTAWAMVVAERMGFKREEALSIGQSTIFFSFPGTAHTDCPRVFPCSIRLHRDERYFQGCVSRDIRGEAGKGDRGGQERVSALR